MSAMQAPPPTPIDGVPAALGRDLSTMPQWRLVLMRFARHRLALAGAVVLGLISLLAAFADFVAPADPIAFSPRYTYAPPQTIRLWSTDTQGRMTWGPHVLDYKVKVDPRRATRVFEPDVDKPIPIGLFTPSAPYRLWGLVPMERKLFGPTVQGRPFFLLGADRLGRDVLSRTIHGAQVSLTVGLAGVILSLVIGIVLGGISGYFGGWVDDFVQRVIDFILSLPTIPLWLGLAAALPKDWSPLTIYFCITVILSLVGWTGIARVVRSRFLALRQEDFVVAAELDGCSRVRVIFRHMLPSITSHIIAVVTLAIPSMILSETALSFLGLGLQPPIVSWGVLLQDAQSVRALSTAPWLLTPGLAVVAAVLAFNFIGDGLRDAADPYAQ